MLLIYQLHAKRLSKRILRTIAERDRVISEGHDNVKAAVEWKAKRSLLNGSSK